MEATISSKNIVGDLIRQARTRQGISQQDIADKLYRSRQWISKVERGEIDPGINQVMEIVTAIGLDRTSTVDFFQEFINRV